MRHGAILFSSKLAPAINAGGGIVGDLGKPARMVIYFLFVLAPIYVNVYLYSEYVIH